LYCIDEAFLGAGEVLQGLGKFALLYIFWLEMTKNPVYGFSMQQCIHI